MRKIKLKRILATVVLTLVFLTGSFMEWAPRLGLGRYNKFSIVYAAPKGSSGGFKSGGFSTTPKSSSPSGGYKSGGFSTTPKTSTPKTTTPKSTTPKPSSGYESTRRSYFPIPIPFGVRGYGYRNPGYGFGFGIFSFIWSVIKIIIIIAIILWVLKRIRRR